MSETGPELGGADDKVPATKQAVYETAIRLFARNGFEGAGASAFAAQAQAVFPLLAFFAGLVGGLQFAVWRSNPQAVWILAVVALGGAWWRLRSTPSAASTTSTMIVPTC